MSIPVGFQIKCRCAGPPPNPPTLQVMIVSYETFRIHAERFKAEGTCDLLICDEVGRTAETRTSWLRVEGTPAVAARKSQSEGACRWKRGRTQPAAASHNRISSFPRLPAGAPAEERRHPDQPRAGQPGLPAPRAAVGHPAAEPAGRVLWWGGLVVLLTPRSLVLFEAIATIWSLPWVFVAPRAASPAAQV